MTLSPVKQFIANFDWTDSTLTPTEIAISEELLVEFHDIFARHRFDIGMNEDLRVQLTPKDNSTLPIVKTYQRQLTSNLLSLKNWQCYIDMGL